jgi:predicted amidohydrolase
MRDGNASGSVTEVTALRVAARLTGRQAPAAGEGVRLALYQGQSAAPLGSAATVEANLARMDEVAERAAAYRSQMCVFPEKFNTGYAVTLDQCRALAEPYDGPSVNAARMTAKTHGLAVVLPYPERDGDRYFDSIAVVDASGILVANYRKSHLYGAAERRNYSFGDELPPVFDVNGLKVGVLNCYECEFPPLYQYLAEQGVRLVVGPTAADFHFPLADGTPSLVPYQDATRHIIPAMASVWRLFVAYANRRGWEHTPAGSWQYRGNSGIWAPNGDCVLAAGPDERADDTLLIADCVPDGHPRFSPEGNHTADNRLALRPALRAPA